MSRAGPKRTASTPWDSYTRLDPSHRTIMRLASLLWLPSPHLMMPCLNQAGLRGPDGRAWAWRSVSQVGQDLARRGLLNAHRECRAELLHRVAVDAADSDEGKRLIQAIRSCCPASALPSKSRPAMSFEAEPVYRLLRLAIYANDEAGFAVARDQGVALLGSDLPTLALVSGLFAEVELGSEWLASRQPAIRRALLDGRLAAALWTGAAGPDLAAVVAEARKEAVPGTVPPLLLSYDLAAANLDGLRLGLAGPETTARRALEAAVAFLEGRQADSVEHYRESLKRLRKERGKRRAFFDDAHGLLFLLALLAAEDPALLTEAQAVLDAAEKAAWPHAEALPGIQALLWLAQGADGKARQLIGPRLKEAIVDPFSAACTALAAHAVDTGFSRDRHAALVRQFERLRDVLPLVARIFAEILAETAPNPAPYRAWLEGNATWVTLRFTRLLATRPPWERALGNLSALLGAGKALPAAKEAARAKRLAWFLDPETREIEVVEQAPRAAGGWSDGRPVAMKRLHEQDARLDYLTPQDRTALRSIRREGAGWYDGSETFAFDVDRTILALVGHPALFDARHRSRPIELVTYPLELVVTERGDAYHIALSHTADKPTVFLEAETPSRYRVVEMSPRVLPMQEVLGRDGLTVPKSARDQVVALVQRSDPALPVRADIEAVGPAATPGDPAPVVQLVPLPEGLRLSVMVRPFGAAGPAYVAGLGGRAALASVGGQQQRVNRDLAAERAGRAALFEACPILRTRLGDEGHEAAVDGVQDGLELLLELQAYPGPVTVEWPEGGSLRVSAVTPSRLKLRVAQARDWFSVEGTVALDEGEVVEMRFLLDRLDRAQGRFVPLEDGRFLALTQQLQAQLKRLEAVSEPHRIGPDKVGQRVHALGVPALRDLLEEASDVKTDAAWRKQVERIRAAEGWTPKLPRHLQAELRDYQVEGFAWMSRLARWGAGACLADDMGLGKTVQAIAVLLDQAGEGPCLVVAPTSVCGNWEAEIARFAPSLTVHRFAGAAGRAGLVAGLGPNDVLVCSYGLLHQAGAALGEKTWQVVVLDEAQAIKNAETKRAQASLSLQARFRLALTGTPVENYLDELWSLFSFVNPGLLGSRQAFQKRFAGPIERDGDAHARQALRALIRPFLLRRTKAAVLTELPPRTEQTMHVEMGGPERVFYEALRQRALDSIAALDAPDGRRKIHILAEITRLRRACCNPALVDAAAGVSSGKLAAFLDLVDELVRNRHRALVFSQFVGHLGLVREALDGRGIAYEYLDGSTPAADRQRRVAAFQAGGADLFLISLRAGGTGLNLTAADYVVHLDPWWNPAVEDQASDRAHRIGQERPVTIYRLIMQDSIEERIVQLHRDKRDLASELLDGTEAAGRLSEEELIGLI